MRRKGKRMEGANQSRSGGWKWREREEEQRNKQREDFSAHFLFKSHSTQLHQNYRLLTNNLTYNKSE